MLWIALLLSINDTLADIPSLEERKMAKVIALFNHKGGVSKTTTTFHIGAMLSKMGKMSCWSMLIHNVILPD
uniref:AAA domain-containing protein n=1 Tax=Candidatus Kentrum sp. LFY TaxID=2126342 RepID=A0A450WDT5_9GAMM|nr:MAG: hypothetical protein BECKLFY1418C_GA0070996_101328 [Candidatus Kentron sp. LFY]